MKIKRVIRPPAEPRQVPVVEPLAAWGPSPFAPRDDVDGARIAGYRMVRGPDGQLVAIAEPKEPTNDH